MMPSWRAYSGVQRKRRIEFQPHEQPWQERFQAMQGKQVSEAEFEQHGIVTEAGMAHAEKLLAHRMQPGGLYDPANMPLLHHINQALRAHTLFKLDVDYMIKDGGVVIVEKTVAALRICIEPPISISRVGRRERS